MLFLVFFHCRRLQVESLALPSEACQIEMAEKVFCWMSWPAGPLPVRLDNPGKLYTSK